MQKQGYTFGHLSLTQSIALDIPSGIATMRDHNLRGCSQKKRFGCFEGHLPFWVSGVESSLIFYTKKIRKN